MDPTNVLIRRPVMITLFDTHHCRIIFPIPTQIGFKEKRHFESVINFRLLYRHFCPPLFEYWMKENQYVRTTLPSSRCEISIASLR